MSGSTRLQRRRHGGRRPRRPHRVVAGLAAALHRDRAGAGATAAALRSSPSRRPPEPGHGGPRLQSSRALVGLSVLGACVMVGEGAMADWTPVYLASVVGTGPGLAASGYAVFSAAMMVCRLAGDRLIERVGRVRLVRLGTLLAAAGMSVALLLGTLPAALAGLPASAPASGRGAAGFSAAGRLDSRSADLAWPRSPPATWGSCRPPILASLPKVHAAARACIVVRSRSLAPPRRRRHRFSVADRTHARRLVAIGPVAACAAMWRSSWRLAPRGHRGARGPPAGSIPFWLVPPAYFEIARGRGHRCGGAPIGPSTAASSRQRSNATAAALEHVLRSEGAEHLRRLHRSDLRPPGEHFRPRDRRSRWLRRGRPLGRRPCCPSSRRRRSSQSRRVASDRAVTGA
jgi:hypothetical protein